MSVRIKEYKFFRSLSVKVNDNWPVRKAEQLWRQLRAHKIAGWSVAYDRSVAIKRRLTFCFISAEIETAEACKWLRAAGFPQYAQMYEGNSNRPSRLIDRFLLGHFLRCTISDRSKRRKRRPSAARFERPPFPLPQAPYFE